jgi:flagellum-specific peptidoglycan hydrolase FlgJ
LAQGIFESMAGQSDLALASNNHFGIKCKETWTGAKVYHDDDARGECFRKYATVEESYRDHSDFLRTRPHYAFLFDLNPTDYEAWAHG